jgi:hypothetical protein
MLITKVIEETKYFNANQKVKVVEVSGNLGIKVNGRYRGRFRPVTVWMKKTSLKWPLMEVPDPVKANV